MTSSVGHGLLIAQENGSTDWTVVLTALVAAGGALVAALLTGTLGYLAAKRQSAVEVRRIEAENERLREQHREDHLRNRQGTYHNFLTADRILVDGFRTGFDGDPAAALENLTGNHRHLAQGVLLFGAPPVRDATEKLLNEYALIAVAVGELDMDASAVENSKRIAAAFADHQERVAELRTGVLEAMRSDVGPDAPPTG